MDLTEITKIVELMSKYELTEIDIKSDDLALTIKRGGAGGDTVVAYPVPAAPVSPAAAAEAAPAAETDAEYIEAPVVGTFYAAPSPGAPPFVSPGDPVTADTVVCIIEAMKVMNEIKAEREGIIDVALAQSGQAVEFGQPLFSLK